MKSILKLTIALLLISIIGCEEKDNQAKEADPALLNTQREALNQAKQVQSKLQDAATRQRKATDESANGQEQ